MAEFYTTVDSVRELSVYVQADKEGHLEKKLSRVIGTKTSKRWCSVQGPTFYQQKSRQGVGEIEVTDMSEVQFVRKVTADITGTQFEIIKKKTQQVFICPTKEECSAWVRALQTAMTLKDHRAQQHSSIFYSISSPNEQDSLGANGESSVYENDSSAKTSRKKHEDQSSLCNVYATPQDTLDNENTSVHNDEENIYSVIADNGSQQSSLLSSNTNNAPSSTTRGPAVVPRFVTPKSGKSACENEYSNEGGGGQAEHSTMASHDKQQDHHQGAGSDADETAVDASEDSMEDNINHLFTALDDQTYHAEDLEHMLTVEDIQPLQDLKNFLLSNDIHCRLSANRRSQSIDPITDCKSFLAKLNSTM